MAEKKILIIEDDPEISSIVEHQFKDLGYSADHSSDGQRGLEMALAESYALVVIDLGLPGLGGLEVCRQLREQRALLPIMILTGEGGETKTVLGLELGADEYIQKPVRSMEFRARARALLRRSTAGSATAGAHANAQEKPEHPAALSVLDFEINFALREVRIEDTVLELTPIEFDILALLSLNPNRVYSREAILSEVWGSSNFSQEQNVRTHISRLRLKLEAAGKAAAYIVTKRGHGYRIAQENEQ